MGSVWNWIKENPIVAGGAIFLFLVFVIILGTGTATEEVAETSSTGYPDYSAAVASSNALQQMTIQGQVASRISDNERAAKEAETNAAVAIGRANFDYLTNKDILTANVAVRGFQADEATAGLAASTAIRVSDNQRATQEASFSRDIQVATLAGAVANHKASTDANVSIHEMNIAQNVRAHELSVRQYLGAVGRSAA